MLPTSGATAVIVYGEPLLDFGLSARGAIVGYGLVSNGLLWEYPYFWTSSLENITTTWTPCEGGIFEDED